MNIISYIALLFLSLVGYSAGATVKGRRSVELKPKIIDLVLILIIWSAAIYTKMTIDLNKWLLILIFFLLGILIGVFAMMPRDSKKKLSTNKEFKFPTRNLIKMFRLSLKNFSTSMGNFQSRILLSLFFFIIISPFALATKFFSDPLNIKRKESSSFWLTKKNLPMEIAKYRRQF